MENLKEIISKNLIYLRKKNNLTQIELANKINYSDNAVSRWERGDVTPSIEILEILSNFYQVPVKSLIDENLSTFQETTKTSQTANRILTVIFSVSVVWLVVIIAFIYRQMIAQANDWILFVAGVPLSCLVSLYYNKKWGNKIFSLIVMSILVWALITTIYLYFLQYNMWLLFLLGVPCQAAIITGFFIKTTKK